MGVGWSSGPKAGTLGQRVSYVSCRLYRHMGSLNQGPCWGTYKCRTLLGTKKRDPNLDKHYAHGSLGCSRSHLA